MKIGLIGYGYWGKILLPKLKKFGEVLFVATSKDNYYDKLHSIDWVVVATPTQTHYEIVKKCLLAGKNVFCEKSLTLDYETSLELYEIAKKHGVKLYVNDVFMFRNKLDDIKKSLNNTNEFDVKWCKIGRSDYGKFIMSNLYNLAWHDFYIIYNLIGGDVSDIEKINTEKNLNFSLKISNKKINFFYDRLSDYNEHKINGVDLMHDGNDKDALTKMFEYIFNNNDYSKNEEYSLFCAKLIDILRKKLFTNINVVGGGIFGVTCAWLLSKNGYFVNLYEKQDRILSSASSINQYRLHRGYHYPRSDETALLSKVGEKSFIDYYGDSIMTNTDNYYCIAKQNSKVDKEKYLRFLKRIDLNYKEVDDDLIDKDNIELCVKVEESLFDSEKIKEICKNLLDKYIVKLNLNSNYNKIDENFLINCTYANKNYLSADKQDLQFELCEKPLVKLPDSFKNKSFVIMDGPFMCIDPYGDTGLHVMGNVIHAIHSTNVGKFPKYDKRFDKLLNNGIIKNPPITNIDKFVNTAKFFFKDIKVKHIGSMFTIRTVLPNRDHDDARPTFYGRNGNKIDVLSGKIGTCVDLAQKIVDDLNA